MKDLIMRKLTIPGEVSREWILRGIPQHVLKWQTELISQIGFYPR